MDSDSENDYTGWNFTAARKLLRASRKDLIAPPPASFDLSTYLPPKEAPSKGLGDFDRLLKLLRKPGRHLDRSDADSYTSSSNQSTPPTSAQEDNAPIEHFDDLAGRPTSGKGVRWKDEIAGQDLADFRRRSLQSEKVANTLDETDTEVRNIALGCFLLSDEPGTGEPGNLLSKLCNCSFLAPAQFPCSTLEECPELNRTIRPMLIIHLLRSHVTRSPDPRIQRRSNPVSISYLHLYLLQRATSFQNH